MSLRIATLFVFLALLGLIASIIVVAATEPRYDSIEARTWLRGAKPKMAELIVPVPPAELVQS